MTETKKPRIVLLLGDPCGIGPELAAKLLAAPETLEKADIIVVADPDAFRQGQQVAGVSLDCPAVSGITAETGRQQGLVLLENSGFLAAGYTSGVVSRESGSYQLDCLGKAVDLCLNGLADGICFAPLNKEAMHLAGLSHEDESGFFIEKLDHKGDFGLLNTLGNLWTSRATSHVSHRQVSEILSVESILEATRLLHNALLASGKKEPKIAVAGLNPHAGDGGMFGSEEIDIIGPAIQKARDEGIDAKGPYPADTIFLMGRAGRFDAIVTMYHDQGQIAMKLMGFDHGVTLHAGLKYPITTSAHGSAFDIAGKGIASENALKAAFALVCSMAEKE